MFAASLFTLSALLQPPLAQISRRDATAAALAAAFLPAVRRANAIAPEEEKIRAEAMQYAYAQLAATLQPENWEKEVGLMQVGVGRSTLQQTAKLIDEPLVKSWVADAPSASAAAGELNKHVASMLTFLLSALHVIFTYTWSTASHNPDAYVSVSSILAALMSRLSHVIPGS